MDGPARTQLRARLKNEQDQRRLDLESARLSGRDGPGGSQSRTHCGMGDDQYPVRQEVVNDHMKASKQAIGVALNERGGLRKVASGALPEADFICKPLGQRIVVPNRAHSCVAKHPGFCSLADHDVRQCYLQALRSIKELIPRGMAGKSLYGFFFAR